jgi:hypothetical protein
MEISEERIVEFATSLGRIAKTKAKTANCIVAVDHKSELCSSEWAFDIDAYIPNTRTLFTCWGKETTKSIYTRIVNALKATRSF